LLINTILPELHLVGLLYITAVEITVVENDRRVADRSFFREL